MTLIITNKMRIHGEKNRGYDYNWENFEVYDFKI
jgi:hypothetical protein